jgi:hypothetical protein
MGFSFLLALICVRDILPFSMRPDLLIKLALRVNSKKFVPGWASGQESHYWVKGNSTLIPLTMPVKMRGDGPQDIQAPFDRL